MNAALWIIALVQVGRLYLFWKSERVKNNLMAKLQPMAMEAFRSIMPKPWDAMESGRVTTVPLRRDQQ